MSAVPRPSLLSRITYAALMALYRRQGWRAVGVMPPSRGCVIIAAPHTSNWDFLLFLGITGELGFRPHFMGKHSLFHWPMGRFMRDMGGVPVNRAVGGNYVDAMVAEFRVRDDFYLTIAPEGTRKGAARWRTGFYQIALQARVPIVCGFVDYPGKTGGLGPSFMPSGDYAADMAPVMAFYAQQTGRHPERTRAHLTTEGGDV